MQMANLFARSVNGPMRVESAWKHVTAIITKRNHIDAAENVVDRTGECGIFR